MDERNEKPHQHEPIEPLSRDFDDPEVLREALARLSKLIGLTSPATTIEELEASVPPLSRDQLSEILTQEEVREILSHKENHPQ